MINRIVKLVSVILILSISSFSCQNDIDCKAYQLEKHLPENSNLEDSIRNQIQDAYIKLEETKELETEYESYRIIYTHSLMKIYNLWTFEKKLKGGILFFKEFEYDNSSRFPTLKENVEIELSVKDWNHVKHLIENFNFWTTKEYKEKIVADGGGYVIEGYRPDAKYCDKLERKLVLRIGSSNIDEINWLCSDLISVYIHKNEN